jgi:hypothetical protein
MHAIVPYSAVVTFIDVLHEAGIYDISLFSLVLPRTVLKPVKAKFLMLITPITVLVRKDESVGKFATRIFWLTSFADLPAPSEAPDQLVGALPNHALFRCSRGYCVLVLSVVRRLTCFSILYRCHWQDYCSVGYFGFYRPWKDSPFSKKGYNTL